ncbi:GNAT family N-acetyltransferase [Streptomyces sp. NPDC086554]|uniref:GNAT family N-acetyltransferase n=1 Tax=Streptomyces sp. NPDC086554 TaxID=3154864 RepID=UPI00341BC086
MIQSFPSVDQVPTKGLVPAQTLYSSTAWLRLLDHHGHGYEYVLLRQGAARSLAPLTAGSAVHVRRYHPDFLLADHIPAAACVVIGPRTGYRNELPSSGTSLTTGDLTRGLQEAARDRAVLLPYLSSTDAAQLTAAGHPAGLIAWEAWLDVPGDGFNGYLNSVGRSRKNQIKGDLRRVSHNGLTFQVAPLDASAPFEEIARLLVLHEKKYDPSYQRPPSEFLPYLSLCADVPGAYVILAYLDRHLIGCHVVFHYGDVLWVRLFGVDESLRESRSSYFSLFYYEPLRLAHSLGARAVHLGIGASDTKLRRGARLEPLWTVALVQDDEIGEQVRQGLRSRSSDLPDPLPECITPPDAP